MKNMFSKLIICLTLASKLRIENLKCFYIDFVRHGYKPLEKEI